MTSAFHVLQKICRIKKKRSCFWYFHIWTWYTPTIVISSACHGFSIKIYLYSYLREAWRTSSPRWTSQNFELVHINGPVFRATGWKFRAAGWKFRAAGWKFRAAKNRVSLAGVTENAGPKCRSSSELERKLHENMLATCSLMYIQLIFITYHIKKCFWLQFNRSEPCCSSGCVRNRQGSGTKYRLSKCKDCIKCCKHRDDSGTFLAHKI